MAWVVDTCILLDIRLLDEAFGVRSAHCLEDRLPDGLVISPITYVELAPVSWRPIRLHPERSGARAKAGRRAVKDR